MPSASGISLRTPFSRTLTRARRSRYVRAAESRGWCMADDRAGNTPSSGGSFNYSEFWRRAGAAGGWYKPEQLRADLEKAETREDRERLERIRHEFARRYVDELRELRPREFRFLLWLLLEGGSIHRSYAETARAFGCTKRQARRLIDGLVTAGAIARRSGDGKDRSWLTVLLRPGVLPRGGTLDAAQGAPRGGTPPGSLSTGTAEPEGRGTEFVRSRARSGGVLQAQSSVQNTKGTRTESPDDVPECVAELMTFGLRRGEALELANKHTLAKIWQVLDETRERHAHGKVRWPIGFAKRCLERADATRTDPAELRKKFRVLKGGLAREG